ncbi:hypothetical protein K2173_025534 [Erythroxylum novogranatense]|uniref:HRDC domain-containing protein n=1 Tax=Erythroxylum novogranatense TaxID=1862640 RepID=A0AAV8T9Z7_9ROSI|nr:hypothetical protein K2173_025534 [Erythroxylum novogranatense]
MDQPTQSPRKSETLQTLTSGPLSSSLSSLASSSQAIPSEKDFHFYNNFNEFKLPIRGIASKSQSLLKSIGLAGGLFKEKMQYPGDIDVEDAYDWLVNVNDEILEDFQASVDDFERARKEEEELDGVSGVDSQNGFQLVSGRKKKATKGLINSETRMAGSGSASESRVKVADNKKGIAGVKAKVPFHIPTIRRPQDEYNIVANNSNQPFQHVWLDRTIDGSRFVHPLEMLSVLDFVDKNVGSVQPVPPLPTESTPFKLVQEVKDLKEVAAKLRCVNEFAVDLEHNQYRSFQGLTCLMQISTRTEDFILDTLKLRVHIGPYLRELFKDPSKKKVMHGADRDIVWLQRDFGIYVCNLFDTGQASRVLKLQRNSLEYLLHHFCGIIANKEYQNADWRLRPLPEEMLRYAREDTHYLLHIYDLMKTMLHSMPSDAENSDPPLVQVYKRSHDVCMQLYEKELLTETSYLYIYGLQDAEFNAQQLAVVSGLFEWRDVVARAEDESTGYILPNKTLLEIAKQMPVTTSKLRKLLRSKHPFLERNLGSIVSIIRHSMQNASAFEAAAQLLKEGQKTSEANIEVDEVHNVVASDVLTNMATATAASKDPQVESDKLTIEPSASVPEISRESNTSSLHSRDTTGSADILPSAKVIGSTVQILKKPTSGFGAMLGGAAARRKFDTEKNEGEKIKLEKIRSSVNLPFHSFLGGSELQKPAVEEPIGSLTNAQDYVTSRAACSNLEEEDVETTRACRNEEACNPVDVIPLENDSMMGKIEDTDVETINLSSGDEGHVSTALQTDESEEPLSLSELSSSFKKCFQPNKQTRETAKVNKPQEPTGLLQLKPFDYSTARKQVIFGEGPVKDGEEGGIESPNIKLDSKGGRKSSAISGVEGSAEFRQGKRRQAFPASGNRSATFR